jgi:multidrug efflux system outer membrane protein
MMTTRASTFALAMAIVLPGCSLAPKLPERAAPIPAAWPSDAAYPAPRVETVQPLAFDAIFRDARLRTLVATALEKNRDVQVAAANLAAARAQVRVIRSAQFPQIDASGSATTADSSGIASTRQYEAVVQVPSFELDLFGKLANATRAERDRALATEAAGRTIRLALIADLADAWATYAADRDLLAVATATATNARRSVELTRARLEGGVAPRTDLRQAEQILATAEGDVASQVTALAQDENLIRLLIGGEFDTALLPQGMDEVLAGIDPAPAGMSSDVLLTRPDVMEAEYLMRAANADIGVARAELFPSISLTGLLGFASGALSNLFTSGAFLKSAGADVRYSIFSGGGVRANIQVSEAQRDAALARYEGTVQVAFREAADALAYLGTIGERQRASTANRAAAEDTARLVEARYRGGVDSYLANLDAQRSLYTARQSETRLTLEQARNRIALYRVLGGQDSL